MPEPIESPPAGSRSDSDAPVNDAALPATVGTLPFTAALTVPAQPVVDRPGAARASRLLSRGTADAIALAGILGITLVAFWARVRLDRRYFNGDILTQFMPLYTAVADRLRSGDLPGWNPALFSGMPLAGDPISGWGYLPAMGFFLLFGPLGAYQAHVFFHLVLAGIATYLLGRRLGMGMLGALAASLAYELGPHLYFTKCCTARMQLGPWIPLGLLTVEMGVRSRSWRARVLWWGATGAVISQVIAGYFGKGAYYGVLTIGAYAAYRTLIDPPEPLRLRQRLVAAGEHCAAILLFGFGLSAATVLPRLDFMGRANLEGGSYDVVAPEAAQAKAWSLGRALTNILNPADLKYFVGSVTFALAIAGVVLAGRRFATPFFAIFSFCVLMLTLDHTPVHTLAYLLPQFRVIHEHVAPRILVVFNIGPAILAGAAITVIERQEYRIRRLVAALLAVLASAGAIAWIAERDHVHFNADVRAALVVMAVLLGGIALLSALLRARSSTYAGWVSAGAAGVLVLALAWNLGNGMIERARSQGVGLPPLTPVAVAYADRDDASQAGAFVAGAMVDGPIRYLGYDSAFLSGQANGSNYYHAFEDDLRTEALLVNNRAVMLGLQDAQGYNPVHSMRYVEYIDAMNAQSQAYHETNLLGSGINSPLLNLLNVRYIVVPAQVPPGRPDLLRLSQLYPTVYADDAVRILDNTSALPRAWIVHTAREVGEGQALPLLASGEVDARAVALLETSPPPLAQPAAGTVETVSVTHYEPDRITLATSSDADGLLMLSEMYDPGWHAFIDGKRSDVNQADHIFRAIPLPAGSHTVELRYEPRALSLGMAITTLTAGFLLAVALYAGPLRRFGVLGRVSVPKVRRRGPRRHVGTGIMLRTVMRRAP